MNSNLSIATAPKTSTFQMRINPELKKELENIYASCGMTLTDAINTFLQQSLNVKGLPFILNQNTETILKEQAIAMLMSEIQNGINSVKTDNDWISEEAIRSEFIK